MVKDCPRAGGCAAIARSPLCSRLRLRNKQLSRSLWLHALSRFHQHCHTRPPEPLPRASLAPQSAHPQSRIGMKRLFNRPKRTADSPTAAPSPSHTPPSAPPTPPVNSRPTTDSSPAQTPPLAQPQQQQQQQYYSQGGQQYVLVPVPVQQWQQQQQQQQGGMAIGGFAQAPAAPAVPRPPSVRDVGNAIGESLLRLFVVDAGDSVSRDVRTRHVLTLPRIRLAGWSCAMPSFDWAYILSLAEYLSSSSSASKDAAKALVKEFKVRSSPLIRSLPGHCVLDRVVHVGDDLHSTRHRVRRNVPSG